MAIRNAKKEDAETIINFQLEMAKETEGIELDYDILTSGVKAVFEDKTKGQYFIAEEDNNIVGSFLITYEWSDWRNGQVWWFQSVYVKPEHRGKGLFRKMYDYILNKIDNDSMVKGIRLYVDESNKNAQKVYQAVGMNGDHYKVFEAMK